MKWKRKGRESRFFPRNTDQQKQCIRKDKQTKQGLHPVQLSALFALFFHSAAKPKDSILLLFCSKLLLRGLLHCWPPPFYHLPIITVGFHTFPPLQRAQGGCLPHWNNCQGLVILCSNLWPWVPPTASAWRASQLLASKMRAPFSAELDLVPQDLSSPTGTGISD